MPTAAKLVAGLTFAFLAYLASDLFKPLLPDGMRVGLLSPVNAALGFIIGWIVMGPLAGKGYSAAAGSGVRTSATLAVCTLFAWSLWIMIGNSTKFRYDGPMEAIVAVFGLVYDYGALLTVDPTPAIVLLIGGICSGYIVEWVGRRFS